MKLNAHIPPDLVAVAAFHRAIMAVGAFRLAGHDDPSARAVARALRATAAGRIPAGEREWIARIEARRREIPSAMVAAADSGDPRSVPDKDERLDEAWQTCRWTSLGPAWGRFLIRLLRELAPRSCLELGTGLGLSAAYQAAALELNGLGGLVTMDAHPAARIAERGFSALGLDGRVELEFGQIDDRLPAVLERVGPIDCALLDADHSETATVRHFDAVLPRLSDGAVVVLDDIAQTDEMRRAWKTVTGRERVCVALPLRRIGIVIVAGLGDRVTC